MDWLLLVLVVLATARLTHLLADDYILSKPRDWYIRKTQNHYHLSYLATCTWCMSIWVSGAVVLLLGDDMGLTGWQTWTAWPALSYAVVMLEAMVERLYDDGSEAV